MYFFFPFHFPPHDVDLWFFNITTNNRAANLWKLTSVTNSVFEIALSTLVDIRSTNELTFGGPALIVVDRRNMQ